VSRKRNTLENIHSKFWRCVEKTPTCWLWLGPKSGNGYGLFKLHYRSIGAHRIAYALANKLTEIPKLFTLHKCDNKLCVNPDHLYLGDRLKNIHDCIERGGLTQQKLSNEEVAEVVKRYRSGEAAAALAKAFNIHISSIYAWDAEKGRAVFL